MLKPHVRTSAHQVSIGRCQSAKSRHAWLLCVKVGPPIPGARNRTAGVRAGDGKVIVALRCPGSMSRSSPMWPGSLRTLIGADLLNLDKIRALGAPRSEGPELRRHFPHRSPAVLLASFSEVLTTETSTLCREGNAGMIVELEAPYGLRNAFGPHRSGEIYASIYAFYFRATPCAC